MRVGGVLLASGQGRRFGSNKLLAEVEGIPLYRRAMDTLAGAGLHRLAVCSPYPEILAAGENSGFLPLRNEHAAEGISASVRLGLSAMEDLDGVLFAVCDQPYLTTESIINLINSFQELKTAICALSWQGQRGNPVIFPRDLFGELAALTGDVGGGAVIRRHPDRLLLVEAFSTWELSDVDKPEDLP
ncbi:nucleotidyltransferase family protein [Flavonifractor sp. HCP28S3_F3]|uniref:nucleotidyltransferase family protein n=1 Tax=Flavonifractor sp. HCP28S3_F3 TaxID=3438939 RepID=UPI003F8AF802